jgi:ABC-2 type transport system permease protein
LHANKKKEIAMQPERVYAIMLRYMLVVPRDLSRIFELVFYPLIDIVLWGFMGLWMQESQKGTSSMSILLPASLVLWMIVERTQSEISLNLAEEIWSHNIVNLFVSPMKLLEWLMSVIVLGIGKALFIFSFTAFSLWLFMDINILSIGFMLIPFWLLLVLSGLSLGTIISAIILRFGRNMIQIAWSIPYLILSLSAVFYPLRFLPAWARMISRLLPTSYVFEALRELVQHGRIAYELLLVCLCLATMYMIFGLLAIVWLFRKSKEQGLAKLESD